MAEKDLDAVCRMEREIFGGNAWNRDLFKKQIDHAHSLSRVLLDEGMAAGYYLCEVVGSEATILKLAVHSSFRKRGYASFLLEHLLAELGKNNVNQVFLEVRESNRAARSLYSKAGFTVLSRRKRYYPDGEDALVMIRVL